LLAAGEPATPTSAELAEVNVSASQPSDSNAGTELLRWLRQHTVRDFAEKWLQRGDEDELYDVIVIGSGMGGGILADSLADLGASVLVLEAGGVNYVENVYNLPVGKDLDFFETYKNEPHSALDLGACINFGGRSVYWSAVIPRMSTFDLEYWPSDIRTYLTTEGYEKAEVLLRKRGTFRSLRPVWSMKYGRLFVTILSTTFRVATTSMRTTPDGPDIPTKCLRAFSPLLRC
jgi:hypothetical protein